MSDERNKTRSEDIDWDALYLVDDQVWSGQVNGSLADEVRALSPGRALDIGCGEGADAIWLAEHGWQVTAVDISATAIERAEVAAAAHEIEVDFRAADLLADPPERDAFDLVVLMYPAFPINSRTGAVELIAGAVATGGLLLMVGHAPPDDLENAPFDPADWLQPDDVAADLTSGESSGWDTELHETRPRPGDHHHGSPHSQDVIVRLRRKVTSGA